MCATVAACELPSVRLAATEATSPAHTCARNATVTYVLVACVLVVCRVKALSRGDEAVVEEAVQQSSKLQLCAADGTPMSSWLPDAGVKHVRRAGGEALPADYVADGECCTRTAMPSPTSQPRALSVAWAAR